MSEEELAKAKKEAEEKAKADKKKEELKKELLEEFKVAQENKILEEKKKKEIEEKETSKKKALEDTKKKDVVNITKEDLTLLLKEEAKKQSEELENRLEKKYFLQFADKEKVKVLEEKIPDFRNRSIKDIQAMLSLVEVPKKDSLAGFNQQKAGQTEDQKFNDIWERVKKGRR